MNDDRLKLLSEIEAPPFNAEAQKAARNAALSAFDSEVAEKKTHSLQGKAKEGRLMSIITSLKGRLKMDIRIPVGAALVGILVLPLSWQLLSTTGITPVPGLVGHQQRVNVPNDMEAGGAAPTGGADSSAATPAPRIVVADEAAPMEALNRGAIADSMAVSPEMAMTKHSAPVGGIAAPSPGGGYSLQRAKSDGDQFEVFDEGRVLSVGDAPVSTFSIDVDTASYSYVRRMLEGGELPNPDAVRIEEMVNYFSYAYPLPASAAEPFAPAISVYPAPWNPDTQIMQIGIKGYQPPAGERAAVNLVFLIDTSGSMNEVDKLPLLKRSFGLLLNQLDGNDMVSIVTYAGSAGVVLEPTRASDKAKIREALANLEPGGSTAGAAGIERAYQLAEQGRGEGGISRVILATDGDFNVGISEPDELKRFIKQKRETGVSLSVLGFGSGNYNDALMQSLAQNGDGNAAYIDSYAEARKVLGAEVGSNLVTIARDVKIQVEFNPAFVTEYRLIGYETRVLNREDFNNDTVDAGDVGAGHTVTALYEITPVGSAAALNDPLRYGNEEVVAPAPDGSGELAFFKMRYKLPGSSQSTLIEKPVLARSALDSLDGAPVDARFAAAVAAFGQKLRGSGALSAMSYDQIRVLASGARGEDGNGYRAELVSLIDLAASLAASGS